MCDGEDLRREPRLWGQCRLECKGPIHMCWHVAVDMSKNKVVKHAGGIEVDVDSLFCTKILIHDKRELELELLEP